MTNLTGADTGMKDRNGKPIREGDIVTGLFRWGYAFPAVCVFEQAAFGLAWEHNGSRHFHPLACFYGVDFEVTGNIRDDPEMKEAEG